jgi:hypothetical protein
MAAMSLQITIDSLTSGHPSCALSPSSSAPSRRKCQFLCGELRNARAQELAQRMQAAGLPI